MNDHTKPDKSLDFDAIYRKKFGFGKSDIERQGGDLERACYSAAKWGIEEGLRIAAESQQTERLLFRRLLVAANRYAKGYCVDEAEDVGGLVCGLHQHEDAKELMAAINAVAPVFISAAIAGGGSEYSRKH